MSVGEDFKVVYRILTILEKNMDNHPFDNSQIDHSTFDITEERWKAIMEMLIDRNYIKGAKSTEYLGGSITIDMINTRITLKGLEYLAENSIMKKVYKTLKGAKETIPMI